MCQAPSVPSKFTPAERAAMMAAADPLIMSFVRKRFPRHFDDVCQDVRLAVWKCIDKFDPGRGASWTTYVVSIAKNIGREHFTDAADSPVLEAMGSRRGDFGPGTFQSMANEIGTEDEGEIGEPDAAEEFAEYVHRAVRSATAGPLLAKMSPSAREIVEWVALDGVTPAQVADRIGRTVKDVKLIIRNAARSIGSRFADVRRVAGMSAKKAAAAPRRPLKTASGGPKCERLEPAAIEALKELGPSMKQIAKRVGVGEGTLAGWPKFRAALDAMKAAYPSAKAFRRQATAVAALKECGPNASEIAKRVGVKPASLLGWPGFRAAYDAAKAVTQTLAAEQPRPEPIPAAIPVAVPLQPRSGHGWHFAKRLAPWTAKRMLGRCDRKRARR